MNKYYCILISLFIFCYSYATIINIPADQPTIQAGINVAVDSDTVLVQPGTYIENINYNGKNITVGSLFLTTQDTTYISQTIIDGDSIASVVTFQSGEDSTAFLNGFTITNGYSVKGGGIYCVNNSSPVLDNITVTNNNASGGLWNYGGGIYCYYYSSPDFKNVTIANNNAVWHGGGIYCNHISSPSFENVAITDNSSGHFGGGIFCSSHSNPNFTNVTISGNSADSCGGAFWCYLHCYPTLVNCILWNDIPQEIFTYSGLLNSTYSDIQGGWTGQGNIDADPLFADPQNGDFHLTWANFPIPDSTMSPCIDAGDPNSPLDPDGTIADMGAYYYDQGTGTENSQFSIFNFQLMNYPNPFNPAVAGAGRSPGTTISFNLTAEDAKYAETCPTCRIVIYNVKGQKIRELKIENLKLKINEVVWNGTDENNQPVSSGIYFYSLKIDNKTISTKKCLLIK